jgi:hypothetical protein
MHNARNLGLTCPATTGDWPTPQYTATYQMAAGERPHGRDSDEARHDGGLSSARLAGGGGPEKNTDEAPRKRFRRQIQFNEELEAEAPLS